MSYDEDAARTHLLYELLIEQLVIGRNTIQDELEKPKGEQDVFYLMGQVELSTAFAQAANVLEGSGLIDDEELRCRECGSPHAEHDVEEDGGKGEDTSNEASPDLKPDPSKLN